MSKKDFTLKNVRRAFYDKPPVLPKNETRYQLCRIYADGKPLEPVSLFLRPMQILCGGHLQDLIPADRINAEYSSDFIVVLLDLRYPKKAIKQGLESMLSKLDKKRQIYEKEELVAAVFLENYLRKGTEEKAKRETVKWLKKNAGVKISKGKNLNWDPANSYVGLNYYIKYLKQKHEVKDLREFKKMFPYKG